MAEPSAEICPGCFQPKGIEFKYCPWCGYHPDSFRLLSLLPLRTELAGQYLIGEQLGQGRFGITYRGFDRKLQRRVAIKEYFPNEEVSRSVDHKTLVLQSQDKAEGFQKGLRRFPRKIYPIMSEY